jgi:hypothetical protein
LVLERALGKAVEKEGLETRLLEETEEGEAGGLSVVLPIG